MTNSRRKGAEGERELARFLRQHGFDEARRGRQYKGTEDSPDVVGLDGFHIEAKRIERGSKTIYGWLDQAIRDCGPSYPVVAHRINQREWIGIIRMADLLDIIRVALNRQAKLS